MKKTFITLIVVCLSITVSSCDANNGKSSEEMNSTPSAQSSSNPQTGEQSKVENGTTPNEGATSTPLLSASDLRTIYENRLDTTYFRNHFADKGFKPLLMEDYRNEDGLPVGDWFTEVWGYHMSLASNEEVYYEARLTPESDDALAVVVNHSTDDPDVFIYFSNPSYIDAYQKQLELLGFKHYTGEDYDIWGPEGYKHGGEDVEQIFNLMKEEQNEQLYYLRHAYDY